MALSPQQATYRAQTAGAQLGISPEAYQARLDAMRTPGYTAAMYDPKHGNAVPAATLAHWKAGGTTAQLLGQNYEFLDRGGLGAKGPGVAPPPAPNASGFQGVAPTPAPPTPAPSAQGPQRPGFPSVTPRAPGRTGLGTRMGTAGRV